MLTVVLAAAATCFTWHMLPWCVHVQAQEVMYGQTTCGMYGYSHLTGAYQGGQADFVRVPLGECWGPPQQVASTTLALPEQHPPSTNTALERSVCTHPQQSASAVHACTL